MAWVQHLDPFCFNAYSFRSLPADVSVRKYIFWKALLRYIFCKSSFRQIFFLNFSLDTLVSGRSFSCWKRFLLLDSWLCLINGLWQIILNYLFGSLNQWKGIFIFEFMIFNDFSQELWKFKIIKNQFRHPILLSMKFHHYLFILWLSFWYFQGI